MPEDLIQEGEKQMKNILKKPYLTELAVGCMSAIVMAVVHSTLCNGEHHCPDPARL